MSLKKSIAEKPQYGMSYQDIAEGNKDGLVKFYLPKPIFIKDCNQGIRLKPLHTCSSCQWSGDETHFITKILSIMYRPKHENIQAFKQIKCPKCHNLVTIIFETLDGSIAK